MKKPIEKILFLITLPFITMKDVICTEHSVFSHCKQQHDYA